MASKIIALHGFLGGPRDFDLLELGNVVVPNLLHIPLCSLSGWAVRFNRMLGKGSVLMGYSMGGRLALHCLLANPGLFKAAIIIAAHPGLLSLRLKQERKCLDKEWAKRFRRGEPWCDLMERWNNSPALSSSLPVIRIEEDYDRKYLARCLSYFSLGEQEYLVPKINSLAIPLLWLSAKEEQRCVGISLKHPLSQLVEFENGGHRFLFAMPDVVRTVIRNFLQRL